MVGPKPLSMSCCLLIAAGVISCDNGGPPVVSTVVVAPGSAKLEVGEEQQMTAVVRGPGGDTIRNVTVEWSTRNPFTAVVSEDGLVSGLRAGSTYVVASLGVADSAHVDVFPYAPPFVQLTAGGDANGGHTCGLDEEGIAYCWGRNGRGQLGTGDTQPVSWPAPVSTGMKFSSLSAGAEHTCGVAIGGAAYCWGANEHGQLGDNSMTDRLLPTAVGGGLSFSAINAGQFHTCAVGSVTPFAYCWGDNLLGQLGVGDTQARLLPQAVFGSYTFFSVSAGGHHTCGITTDRFALCWGDNSSGQLGNSPFTLWSAVPVGVAVVAQLVSISAGGEHTCGIDLGSSIAYCWGSNAKGQLGIGDVPEQYTPVAVAGNLVLSRLSAGSAHTCGVTQYGDAFCWGLGQYGQLGDGLMQNSMLPVQVSESLQLAVVSAGGGQSCATGAPAAAVCWGRNQSGELGDGSTVNRSTPVEVGE